MRVYKVFKLNDIICLKLKIIYFKDVVIYSTILRSLAHEIDDSIYSEDYFVSELQHLNPLINTKDITSGMLYSEIRSLRRALEQNKGDAK